MSFQSYEFDYNFFDNGLPKSFCPVAYMNLLSQRAHYDETIQSLIMDAGTGKNLEEIAKIAENYMEHGLKQNHDIDKWVNLSSDVAKALTEKIESLHLVQKLLLELLEVPIRAGSLSKENIYKVIKFPIHRIPEYVTPTLQLY